MKRMLTITRKGQTTLPAKIRAQLGVGPEGGLLQYRFDEQTGQLIITKPLSVDDLAARTEQYVKRGVKPVADVTDYYQSSRKGA